MTLQQQQQQQRKGKKRTTTTNKLQYVKLVLLLCIVVELFNVITFQHQNTKESLQDDNNLVLTSLKQFSSPKDKNNPIEIENGRVGTEDWILTEPALDREIEGYVSHTSINVGESILLFYNTKSKEVSVDIFRTGWYNGVGGRKIGQSVIVPGIVQAIPRPDKYGLVECDWRNPYAIQTSTKWTTGAHLARMTELKSRKQSYAIFVVRDDSRKADVLFQLPVYTYQAYNFWGGMSLYGWGSGGADSLPWGYHPSENAGKKVSFQRPYAKSNHDAAAYGMGAGEYLTNVQPLHHYPISSSAGWNYNMVRWLERNHVDVSYITNVDVHIRLPALPPPKLFLTQGHDEYWTWEMRDYVEDLRDKGVNLAFLSSNTAFWQIRLENTTTNPRSAPINNTTINLPPLEPSTVACFRWPGRDPIKTQYKSIRWRLVNRPEADMIGVEYKVGGDPFDTDLIVYNASNWIFDKTNITNGDVLRGLLGYEVDGIRNDKTNQGYNIHKIFQSPVITRSNKTIICHGTIYYAPESFVFASGSMQWAWGLDDFDVNQRLRTSRLNPNVHVITWNILKAAGIQAKHNHLI